MIKELCDNLVFSLELNIQNTEQLCDIHKESQVREPFVINGHLNITILAFPKNADLITQIKTSPKNFSSAEPSDLLVVYINILCIHLIHQCIDLSVRKRLRAYIVDNFQIIQYIPVSTGPAQALLVHPPPPPPPPPHTHTHKKFRKCRFFKTLL